MKLRVLSARAVYALQVAVRMASVDLGKIVMRAVHVPMEAVGKGMLEGMVALGNTV
jgi:ribosomal protein S11